MLVGGFQFYFFINIETFIIPTDQLTFFRGVAQHTSVYETAEVQAQTTQSLASATDTADTSFLVLKSMKSTNQWIDMDWLNGTSEPETS